MQRVRCEVCHNLRSTRNIHKGVCKACRNKGHSKQDKVPCFTCGEVEKPKKYYVERMFCPSCYHQLSRLPKKQARQILSRIKK